MGEQMCTADASLSKYCSFVSTGIIQSFFQLNHPPIPSFPDPTHALHLHQLQRKPRAPLLPPPTPKNATKIHRLPRPQPGRLPPLRRARTRRPPPPLLARLARKRGKHGGRLGPRVLGEVGVLEDGGGGRGARVRVEGEERGKQRGAGAGEEREAGADDSARGLRGRLARGQAEGLGVGEALEGGPGVFGGDTAEFEDLRGVLGGCGGRGGRGACLGELVDFVFAL